jgi:hypothetical protein
MIFTPQGRGAHWPADYRSYAVELHEQYDAGIITKGEAQCRLAERFPGYELPDERTWRRWAHEKYSNLPGQRQQFFNPQELYGAPVYQPVAYSSYGNQDVVRPPVSWVTQPVWPAQVTDYRSAWALMDLLVFSTLLGMWTAMVRMVNSSL